MADQDTGQHGPLPAVSLGEIAGIGGGRDITRGYVADWLPPQDAVLESRGWDYRAYDYVRSDDQVKSCMQQRQLAVVSREWIVEAGKDDRASRKAATFVKELLDRLGWDNLTEKMLWGVFYGYAVAECIYVQDGAQVTIDRLPVRKQRRFRFDVDRRLRLILPGNVAGEVMPANKFWTFSAGGDNDDDPYGLGLAHWLWWPVWFKRNGVKFWATFLEKFGQPTAIGKYPAGADSKEVAKLVAALRAIATETGVAIPDTMVAELLEAKRSGTGDYKVFHDNWDEAIAKVILSQTMTTEDGASRSQAEVHMGVRQEVVKSDSDLICNSFARGPATWLTRWNFPGATPPKVWRRVEDDPDLAQQATRDKTIYDMGYRPTLDYITDTYGDGFEPKPEPQPPASALPGQTLPAPGAPGRLPAALPAPGRAATVDLAAGPELPPDSIEAMIAGMLDDGGWEPLVAPMLRPVVDLAGRANSLEELRDQLASTLTSMDVTAFQEALQRATFIVRAAGDAGAPVHPVDPADQTGQGR